MTAVTAPAEFTLRRERGYDRRTPTRWLWSHAGQYWPLLIMLVAGAAGNAALAAVVPVLVGNAFNAMLAPAPDPGVLLPLALIIGGSQIVRGVLQFGRNFGAELVAQKVERDVRDELYLSLLGKSMTFHSLQPVGDTMARATNDVREVNFLFSPGMNVVVGSALFIAIPFAIGLRYHPSLVLTPAIFLVVYVAALMRYLKRLSPITDEVRATFGQMNTHLSESLDGVEIVKGAAQEGAEVERFVVNARRVRDVFVRQGDLEARYIAMLLLGLAFAGGLVHALLLYRAGLMSVGAVTAYFGGLRMLEFPTFTATWAYSQISLGYSGARRILALMSRETHLDQNTAGRGGAMRGEIEFRGVSFRYPSMYPEGGNDHGAGPGAGGDEYVLQDVSFQVGPGQTVALVGQTGAAKTTLVRLVNRTYDVTDGQVLVDGVDVRDWNLAALRSQISMIEQDIFLFSRSLHDNIAFGKPGARKEETIAASEAAQAHDFILGFEKGYDTVVGERGVTLSGGERQRIALARAFLTDPRILILDDSTSAIDSSTEDRIQHAIAAAARGRTTLIITHRLSQIRWADLIIVLRKGRVAAMGRHEELLRTSEAYSRIFRE
jgi:ATP-binding cassette subfamily B protein